MLQYLSGLKAGQSSAFCCLWRSWTCHCPVYRSFCRSWTWACAAPVISSSWSGSSVIIRLCYSWMYLVSRCLWCSWICLVYFKDICGAPGRVWFPVVCAAPGRVWFPEICAAPGCVLIQRSVMLQNMSGLKRSVVLQHHSWAKLLRSLTVNSLSYFAKIKY